MSALNPISFAKTALWRVSFALREAGQALERTGCVLQGIYSHEEVLCRHVNVAPVQYSYPDVTGSWVAPSASVLGDVTIGPSSSVWYNASIRGDRQPVTIGKNCNIQDSAFIGGASEFSPPVEIGDNVSIGHGAVLKGCKIGSNALIGIGAVIAEGAEVSAFAIVAAGFSAEEDAVVSAFAIVAAGSFVEEDAVVSAFAIVAAGSYVEEDAVVPPGEVWAGNPARKLRDVKPAEREYLMTLPTHYVERSKEHAEVMELLHKRMGDYAR
eukprot:gene25117-10758_t